MTYWCAFAHKNICKMPKSGSINPNNSPIAVFRHFKTGLPTRKEKLSRIASAEAAQKERDSNGNALEKDFKSNSNKMCPSLHCECKGDISLLLRD